MPAWERPGGSSSSSSSGSDEPPLISACLILDAGVCGTTDGVTLSTVPDISGQANDMTSSVVLKRGVTPGGTHAFRFGGGGYLTRSTMVVQPGSPDLTLFFAGKANSLAESPCLLELGTFPYPHDTTAMTFALDPTGIFYVSNCGSVNLRYTDPGVGVAGAWQVWTVRIQSGAFSASRVAFWVNGVRKTTTGGTGTSVPTLTSSGSTVIGLNTNGVQPFDGDCAEMRLYHEALTDSQIASMVDAIMTKHGIT